MNPEYTITKPKPLHPELADEGPLPINEKLIRPAFREPPQEHIDREIAKYGKLKNQYTRTGQALPPSGVNLAGDE